MRRGTTPTIYVVTNADFSEWHVELAITNGETSITHSGNELEFKTNEDGKPIICTRLTQEETLRFRTGTQAKVQFRAVNVDEEAVASEVGTMSVDEILADGIIEKEG